MRTRFWILVLPFILGVAACDDVPTTSSNTPARLGKITLEDFRADRANSLWFEAAFDAYPGISAEANTRFDSSTTAIRAAFDPSKHSVLMVVTPDCPCHSAQQLMPSVAKTLATAGVPNESMAIYVTNSRMEGIDEITKTHRPPISAAPAFIVMIGGVEMGRMTNIPDGSSVEQELVELFQRR